MTPLYRALCEAALNEYGVLEPTVSARGVFRDELGDLVQAEDGVALILQALALADAATGATIGCEVVKALAKQTGIEGLETRYEVQCASAHECSNGWWTVDGLHRATRSLASQLEY